MAAVTKNEDLIRLDGLQFGRQLGAALTHGYACVKEGASAGLVIECAADTDVVMGFVQETPGTAPAINDFVTVFSDGNIVWAQADGAITSMAYCEPSTAGDVKTRTDGTVEEQIVGQCMATAGDTELFPLRVMITTMNNGVT